MSCCVFFYVRSADDPADGPSRHRSSLDYCLTGSMWQRVQREFGGSTGHTFDLMSLDSNVQKDLSGNSLPHFTPVSSPGSAGVNFFAQDLTAFGVSHAMPYVFPPPVLVGPVLRYLRRIKQARTIAVLDSYLKKYWWPLLHGHTNKAVKWLLQVITMYFLYLRIRVGSHAQAESRESFGCSRLSFRHILLNLDCFFFSVGILFSRVYY